MVKIEKHKRVATVTLNRPEKHNAFDDIVVGMLTDAFIDINQDDSLRVMVLAANGDSFSAGADVAWMKRMANYSYQENMADAEKLATMLSTLNAISIPTIAKVNGATYGGAVGLVSCCDIAIASHHAIFCLSEVAIGLIPATISPYVLAAMGERAARRYFLTAERFNTHIAEATGLISQTCDHQALDSTVSEVVNAIVKNSPKAVSQAKQLIKDINNKPLNEALINETSARIASIRTSDEGQEGLSAFLEKRTPSWAVTGSTH